MSEPDRPQEQPVIGWDQPDADVLEQSVGREDEQGWTEPDLTAEASEGDLVEQRRTVPLDPLEEEDVEEGA